MISIFIVIVAWIIFNIYHATASSTISESLNRNIIPINPNFDTKTIDSLKKRQIITPIYTLSNNNPVIEEPINISSNSANESVNKTTQQATQGGLLKP